MFDPTWLGDTLAVIVLATAAYCASRLAAALLRDRRVEYDADVTHILMGVAMAGMFAAKLSILNATVWEVVFAVISAWYLVRITREARTSHQPWAGLRHHAGHLLSAGAMLYMFLALPADMSTSAGGSGGGGMGMGTTGGMGASVPTLALVFAVALFGYAVLVADRVPLTAASGAAMAGGHGGGAGAGGGRGVLLAPRASAVCEVVMSIAMGVMLIAML
jgi:hypothetical protein